MSTGTEAEHARGGQVDSVPPRALPLPATPERHTPGWLDGVRELMLVGVLYLLYRTGRVAVDAREELAREHADRIRDIQAWLHLPSEAAIQAAVSADGVLRAANVYYLSAHFPIMILFLVTGFLWRPRAEYCWARNLVVAQTLAALVIHLAFPLAPPRMFPEWGFTDTMETLGPSPYDGPSGAAVNQFAAMPSLHVGWAVLIAYAVLRIGPSIFKPLAVAHAVLTCVVVLITANHWWLDGLVGVALLGFALVLFPEPGRSRVPPFRQKRTTPVAGPWLDESER